MLILADLVHDPQHWPSEAATAAHQAMTMGPRPSEAATAADLKGVSEEAELFQEKRFKLVLAA